MDGTDPLPLAAVGLNLNGGNLYHNGDAMNGGIWNAIGGAAVAAKVGPDKQKAFTPAENKQFSLYGAFWQNLTAAYYSTPSAQRLVYVQSLSSLEPQMDGEAVWVGRRPVGIAILIELTLHGSLYKNVKLEPVIGISKLGNARAGGVVSEQAGDDAHGRGTTDTGGGPDAARCDEVFGGREYRLDQIQADAAIEPEL